MAILYRVRVILNQIFLETQPSLDLKLRIMASQDFNNISTRYQSCCMTSTTLKKMAEDVAALKVKTVSLIVLQLTCSDVAKISEQLREKAGKGQAFFRNSPLLLDLVNLGGEVERNWLKMVFDIVESHNFSPVGIVGASSSLVEIAREQGIAVWALPKGGRSVAEGDKATGSRKEIGGKTGRECLQPARVIQQPVRSGQRIYAEKGDLIVMSSVSTGAEIMADGHIHVYGSLRGRALAGVKGWKEARIFCHDLQADLVAIAGYYTINEDLPENRRNTAVQISLQQESLNIDPLHP